MFDQYNDASQEKKHKLPSLPWRRLGLIFAVVFLFVLFRVLISVKLDLAWFSSLGYDAVFWRSFIAKFAIGAIIFAAAVLLNFINIFLVYRIVKKPFKPLIPLAIAIFTATIVAGNSGDLWLSILRSLNAETFGITDPQFNLDIGFYVFKLPFLWLIYRVFNTWFLVNLVTSVILYLIFMPRGMEISARNMTMRILTGVEKKGLTHIGILLGSLIAWQALQYKLSSYELLYSQVGAVIGAGAADVGARLPAYTIMLIASLLIGLFIMLTFRKQIKRALFSIVVFFLLIIVVNGVYPGFYQKFVVEPDELGQEMPYLERNIKYTHLAYGLDKLTEVEYPVGDLSLQDLKENQDIINNMRLLDQRATMSTYSQQQEIRPYYDFVDVDVDRYMIDGKLTQVLLSGRELSQNALPEQARTFNNLLFKYTHGFGLAMSPTNIITEGGLPEYLIKDIPPQAEHFTISEPRIYFGEATNENVIVNTGLKEFDYPMGDDNQEYIYQGKNGIPMTFLNKVLLAFRDVQFKYLLSDYIASDSLYLETRNIKARAMRIAPFLFYDQDPYLVVDEAGKLYYFIDAYTYTDKYPYSQAIDKAGTYNYLRNSVKVIIDAYSGEINFYIFDKQDPIIKVYNKIYPGLFKKAEEMPQDLRQHVRYPEDLFTVQSLMLRDYHMMNPTVFFTREDRWEFSQETYLGEKVVQDPYYSIVRLPGEEEKEYVLMRVFTPARKQNSVAWLAGRSDGDNYGNLILFKFPKGVQVPGTIQVDSLIDQDPNISGQLTLWGSGGSKILRGNLLVYPIGGSLLYLEPLYIEAEQNKYPQLKKIFVSYNNKIVMEDSLEAGLTALFGAEAPEEEYPQLEGEQSQQNLIDRLVTLHRQGQEKLRAGDWTGYGKVQAEMDKIINALENKKQES